MEKNAIIFGTDGWRGIIGHELNLHNLRLVANAFGHYIHSKPGPEKSVALAYDGRKHSHEFAKEFAAALSGSNITVYLSDQVIPTPVLSYFTKKQNCFAGVVVTASHNPPEYNGLKFKNQLGAPFSTEQTLVVEALINELPQEYNSNNIIETDFLSPYLKHLEKSIDFTAIKNSRIKVAIDSMAGAGKDILQKLLISKGIEAKGIDQKPQPDFAGRTAEPIEKNLKPLSELLQSGDFSLGVATDGDADRLGVMDDKGKWMNIQETILYIAEYCTKQRYKSGDLVKTLSVTNQMKNVLQPHAKLHEVQVGFKYISEKMQKHDIAFGAEESGGFGFKDHLPERDGIFSACVFMEMLAKSGFKLLTQFIELKRKELGLIHYARMDESISKDIAKNLLQKLSEKEIKEIVSFRVVKILRHKSSRGIINSLKFILEGNCRWLLIRSSETEPKARIYAEGESQKEMWHILNEGQKMIKQG